MSNNNENKEPLNKSFKVPKLRFPEFKDEWEYLKIGKILKIQNGKDKKFIENENGRYEIYGTGGVIGYTNSFLYNKESVGIGRKGTIDKPFYFDKPFWTVDTLFWSKIKPDYNAKFIYFLFQTINWNVLNQSTGIPSLTSHVIEHYKVFVPNKVEQIKIAELLTLVDLKIKLIQDKILTLKKYKEGYSKVVIKFCSNNNTMLSSICDITTGKLDANAMSAQGKYKFFTCSREDYLIDTYAFDCEAILVSGNGDVGLTKYYRGKFNAYQRTYVLHNFKRDPLFIQICIDSQIKSVIRKETNKGAMPYIKLSTFDKLIIPDLAADKEKVVSSNIKLLKSKEKLLTLKLEALSLIKKYLLNTLFI